jgi:hypothetical protein
MANNLLPCVLGEEFCPGGGIAVENLLYVFHVSVCNFILSSVLININKKIKISICTDAANIENIIKTKHLSRGVCFASRNRNFVQGWYHT